MRFVSDDPAEKVPMEPEDYVALLEWVRAKEGKVGREDDKKRGCIIP